MDAPRKEPRIQVVCGTCGSTDVTRDGWAGWSVEQQEWVLRSVHDHAHCHHCDGETRLAEAELSDRPPIREA